MTKCLVTGGCGFIGSWLVERLTKEQQNVVVFDNFTRFGPDHLDKNRSNVSIIQGDILDFEALYSVAKDCSTVFHLAAISKVDASIANPKPVFEANVMGTYNVLETCRLIDAKCIFPSSWMVYDRDQMNENQRASENHKTAPVTPYGLSKLVSEQYCKLFRELYGLRTTILRLSNVFGPRDEQRLIPLLITKAKKGETIKIFGEKRILNFVYVSDVVDAMHLSSVNPQAEGEIINIGIESSVDLKDLAQLVVSECHSSSSIVLGPSHHWDYEFYLPDISKAKRILGFQPKIDINLGVKLCIQAY